MDLAVTRRADHAVGRMLSNRPALPRVAAHDRCFRSKEVDPRRSGRAANQTFTNRLVSRQAPTAAACRARARGVKANTSKATDITVLGPLQIDLRGWMDEALASAGEFPCQCSAVLASTFYVEAV